jgi:hypothetical protein
MSSTQRLLSNGLTNAKLSKLADRIESSILYFAAGPSADEADGRKGKARDVCPWKTVACYLSCLVTAGRGLCPNVVEARIKRTLMFLNERPAFIERVTYELELLARRSLRKGYQAVCRLNGTSDIPWERVAPQWFESHPEIQFYDYTKSPNRMREFLSQTRWPSNYHLTFSRSEEMPTSLIQELVALGGNVAVVFDVKREHSLPYTWHGMRVIDGDTSDWRFNDPEGVIVGLRAKGKAKQDTSGFVVSDYDRTYRVNYGR